MAIETAARQTVPAAQLIRPMTPPPPPLPRRSLARSPFVERLEAFWRHDAPFLIAGAGLLVGAPVAYHFAAGADPASANNPSLFGQASANEQPLGGMAPGKPLTGLDDSDPASWVMGPSAVHQGPAGGASLPGGAALRLAAGAAMASAGLPSPQADAVRAARQVSNRIAGAPTPLHLEAPSFPGLGGGSSTGASIARAANGVIGEGNGTGMIVRDLKALGGKLAWHGSAASAEGLRGAADRQAQGFNSSSVGGFFTNGGFSPVHGGGAADAGTGIGHEGSQGGGSPSSAAPAADSKNTTSKDPYTPQHSNDSQQPSMPGGGTPGGGQDDKKKEKEQQQQAQQGAQVCQLLGNSGLTRTSAGPGMSSAIPADTANAQQLCGKNLQSLKSQAALHKWARKPYRECQAYCSKAAMGLSQ